MYGSLEKFLTDNRGEFASPEFIKICDSLELTVKATPYDSPWSSNGLVERQNLVLSGMLHKILQDAQCHPNLPVACCMNEKSSFNIVLDFSPCQLNIGKFYSVNLRIQSKCGKIRTRKNFTAFHAVQFAANAET